MAKYVYVLGAGYSRSSHPDFQAFTKYYEPHGYTFQVSRAITGDYSEIHKGAPLTKDLLCDALNLDTSQLSLHAKEKATFDKSRDMILHWLESLYLSDYTQVSIQDVLTYLDMKMNTNADYEELARIKFAMANIVSMLLYVRLGHSSQELDDDFVNYLSQQLRVLKSQDPTSEIIIINLNWDLVIDNALKKAFGSSLYELPPSKSGNFNTPHSFSSKEYAPGQMSIKLIKPHGSLNWMWCHGCETAIIFEGDVITRYILPFPEDEDDIHCQRCGSKQFSPIMVTPSLYRNVFQGSQAKPTAFQSFLAGLWELLDTSLNDISHLTVIGYSLPNEDKELRYYLREAIIGSNYFHGIRIITGSPKPSPSEEEMKSQTYKDYIQQSYQWENYSSFFGTLLDRSFKEDPLNFWISGFYNYFRLFLA